MEDIQMFINLNEIKCMIKDDINKLDKINNELDIKNIYNQNINLNQKVINISNDFKDKMVDINLRNQKLEKDFILCQNEINQKNNNIKALNKEIDLLKKTINKLEEQINIENNNNDNLYNQLQIQCNQENLLNENKNAIYDLYFK